MSIYQTLKQSWMEARKEKNTELAVFLGTFLNDMRTQITKGVSSTLYGVYDPKDEEVVIAIKKSIKASTKAVEDAEKIDSTGESAINFINKCKLEQSILESFLPKQLSDFELGGIVGKLVKEADESLKGGKLMGYVITQLKKDYNGLYDSSKVKDLLSIK